MRFDTLGKLKWSYELRNPLRVKHFVEGAKDNFYFLGQSDSYGKLGKRIDFEITIDSITYNTNKKDSYFLVKYQ